MEYRSKLIKSEEKTKLKITDGGGRRAEVAERCGGDRSNCFWPSIYNGSRDRPTCMKTLISENQMF